MTDIKQENTHGDNIATMELRLNQADLEPLKIDYTEAEERMIAALAPKIKVVKRHPDAVVPSLANQNDAGLDLTTIESVTIPAGKQALVKTGLSFGLPVGTVGLIWPRSKLAAKYGLDVMAGVVDQPYTGEVMVSLINHSDKDVELRKGDRIAQLLVQPVMSGLPIVEVDSLEETSRGAAGINDAEMRLR